MIYLRLFFEFFKIGLFSVGGGLATLPFLQDLSARTGWFTIDDISNMIAVSESTPGPIGVNMATFAGYTTALNEFGNTLLGILGGIVSTLGLIAPAIIIIMIVASVLEKFKENKIVKGAFYGLRAVSIALVVSAFAGVVKTALLNVDAFSKTGNIVDLFFIKGLILAVVIFALSKIFKKLHPTVLILLSAVVGIIFNFA